MQVFDLSLDRGALSARHLAHWLLLAVGEGLTPDRLADALDDVLSVHPDGAVEAELDHGLVRLLAGTLALFAGPDAAADAVFDARDLMS
jgi:hypothetical protein